MGTIFLACCQQDLDFGARLSKDLEKLGATVFMEGKSPPFIEQAQASKVQSIETCELALVVISPESMQSFQLASKWSYFVEHKKQVIPLLYKAASINFQLRVYQQIDFCNQPYEKALQRLALRLRLVPGGTIPLLSFTPPMVPTGPLPPLIAPKPPLLLLPAKAGPSVYPKFDEAPRPELEPGYFDDQTQVHLIMRSEQNPIRLALSPEKVIIMGRSAPDMPGKLDVDLGPFKAEAYGVSRRHASLSVTQHKLYIIDLNSTNSTYLNGKRLTPQSLYPLKSGDVLFLGALQITIEFHPPADTSKPIT